MSEIAKALCAAQSQMRNVEKDKTNPHFKHPYSSLDSCFDAIREPFTRNGLAIVQTQRFEGTTIISVTKLIHSSGQEIVSEMPLLFPGRQDMQAIGSALTYARRYQLLAICGAAPSESDKTEDDGHRATNIPKFYDELEHNEPVKKAVIKTNNAEAPKVQPPNAPPTEQLTARQVMLKKLGSSKWSDAELKDYVKAGFGVDSAKYLRDDQLADFVSIVELKSYLKACEDLWSLK